MSYKSTYGYNIIQDGDRGINFCPLLSANWERIDQHKHDGLNSEKIKSHNLSKAIVDLDFSGWVIDGEDFSQVLTMPVGYNVDDSTFKFTCTSGTHTGKILNLRTQKITTTQLKVFCSFNDINVKVLII